MPEVRIQGDSVMTELILTIISIEAVTELIFRAGPLQSSREWLIEKTPRLDFPGYGHLLECKYCVSFWVGLFFALGYLFFIENKAFLCFLYVVSFHRLSNLLHLPFSYLRDKQLNLRIERNRRG